MTQVRLTAGRCADAERQQVGAALVCLCRAWAKLADAEARFAKLDSDIVKTASGYEQAHPLVGLIARYEKSLSMWGRKFGLSPADRASLSVEKPSPDESPASPRGWLNRC